MKNPFHRPPDLIIGDPTNPYLLRWHVIPRNRFFNIYLHKFLRSDDDRALHDHPWASCSIILKGGYIEHTPASQMFERFGMKGMANFVAYDRRAGSVVFRKASQAHRVELFSKWVPLISSMVGEIHTDSEGIDRIINPPLTLESIPAWTLFITGPKTREWGFHCPNGWKHWREFIGLPIGEPKGNEVGPGCNE